MSFWNPPTWVGMALVVGLVLCFKLALPLISGLVLFVLLTEIHAFVAPRLQSRWGVWVSVALTTVVFLGTLSLAVGAVLALVDTDKGMQPLMIKLTEALTLLKTLLPQFLADRLPHSSYRVLYLAQEWLSSNSDAVAGFGKKIINALFHLTVGGFVGVLVGLKAIQSPVIHHPHPFIDGMLAHVRRFVTSFRLVFFAQFYIALTNTLFTGFFLGVVMPLLGYKIPFLSILVLVTFVMGFIPILGNIVSNTVITLTALSVAPLAAGLALAFLVVIHKLEYFLNAWIVGNKIKVRSYELLLSMLAFEALFGIWGLVLAPVLYSYIKEEFLAKIPLPTPAPTVTPPASPRSE